MVGCAELELEAAQSRLSSISNGMTKWHVLQKMGEPNRSDEFGNNELIFWDVGAVVLYNDKVIHKVSSSDDSVTRYEIDVNSFNGDQPLKRVAMIESSVKGLSKNDLEFQGVKKIVRSMLLEKGYRITEDSKNVDTIVFVNFGISDPKTDTQTWTMPVYDYITQQPIRNTNTTYNVNDQYGQNVGSINAQTTYGNPYQVNIPKPVYRGETTHTSKRTTFMRHLIVEGVDYQYYVKNNKIKNFWKVTAKSTGSGGDIRKVMPFLALASKEYIELDSGSTIKTIFFSNDPRVQPTKKDRK